MQASRSPYSPHLCVVFGDYGEDWACLDDLEHRRVKAMGLGRSLSFSQSWQATAKFDLHSRTFALRISSRRSVPKDLVAAAACLQEGLVLQY